MKKNKVIKAFYEDIISIMPSTETLPYEPWDKYGEICPLDTFVSSLAMIFAPEGVDYWEDCYTEEQGYEPFLKDLREIIDNFTKEDLKGITFSGQLSVFSELLDLKDLTEINFYLNAEEYFELAKEILEYAYDKLQE